MYITYAFWYLLPVFDSFIHEPLKALRNTTVTESVTHFIKILRKIFPPTPLIYLKQNFHPPCLFHPPRLFILSKFPPTPFIPEMRLVILFSVLPRGFIVSGVKSSRLYPFLILNLALFSILFTYICTDGSSVFSSSFEKCIQNSIEYLIQNTIHQVI